jgi:hypothetical protein
LGSSTAVVLLMLVVAARYETTFLLGVEKALPLPTITSKRRHAVLTETIMVVETLSHSNASIMEMCDTFEAMSDFWVRIFAML